MVDELLDLVVETDPLHKVIRYEIFVVSHLLCEVHRQAFLLQVGSNLLAFAEDVVVGLVDVHFRVDVDLFLFCDGGFDDGGADVGSGIGGAHYTMDCML